MDYELIALIGMIVATISRDDRLARPQDPFQLVVPDRSSAVRNKVP
jgi:hypothetical protein